MDKDVKMLLKAIHAKCLECVQTEKEVRECNWEQHCSLHPFRNGKLPAQEDRQTKASGGKVRG